jgi:carboxyl-terminal processing protease
MVGLVLLCAVAARGAENNQAVIDSYELVWSTLRDHYWDASMGGLNWQKLHAEYLTKVKAASNPTEARRAIGELIHKLPSSHLALIPSEVYQPSDSPAGSVEPLKKELGGNGSTGIATTLIDHKVVVEFSESEAVHPGWVIESIDGDRVQRLIQFVGEADAALIPAIITAWLSGPVGSSAKVVFAKGDGNETTMNVPRREPPGKLVQFTNLPPERVIAEHRKLAGGVGYIRLNIFFDPVSVMPEMEQAIGDLRSAPGIILDLRGNPGGLSMMAMGVAGWFVSEEGEILGTMMGRGSKTQFEIYPRPEPYTGKLAVLVDGASGSTSEILAQGLKDLGRARIFGMRTAGEALPSAIIVLPDGDRFQYPEANYTSFKGRVLEGNGVEPDVVVRPTIAALLAGHDLALESAIAWSLAK